MIVIYHLHTDTCAHSTGTETHSCIRHTCSSQDAKKWIHLTFFNSQRKKQLHEFCYRRAMPEMCSETREFCYLGCMCETAQLLPIPTPKNGLPRPLAEIWRTWTVFVKMCNPVDFKCLPTHVASRESHLRNKGGFQRDAIIFASADEFLKPALSCCCYQGGEKWLSGPWNKWRKGWGKSEDSHLGSWEQRNLSHHQGS